MCFRCAFGTGITSSALLVASNIQEGKERCCTQGITSQEEITRPDGMRKMSTHSANLVMANKTGEMRGRGTGTKPNSS